MGTQGSIDITKAAVRPPKFLTGIPSTCGPRMGFPNPRALAAATRPQPFPRGASLDLGQYTLNLYSVYAGCSLKMPLRGDHDEKRYFDYFGMKIEIIGFPLRFWYSLAPCAHQQNSKHTNF